VDFTKKVKEVARAAGADLVGIAPIERFKDQPEHNHPSAIFPAGKAVIVIGKRIPRGALRGIEEGTNWHSFTLFGYNNLDDAWVTETCYNVCMFLEDNGWEGVPIFPHPHEVWPQGIAVAPDRPAPNVIPNFDFAAVAAGLGEIGYGGFFLTPQFGPRQRLGLIITDAPLEGDELYQENLCGDCRQCAIVCPLGAISEEETEELVCENKKMIVGKRREDICRKCQNGAFANRYHERGNTERRAALCARTCIVALERAGKLENVFANPFRKRSLWAVNIWGEAGEIEEKEIATWKGCADPGSTAQGGD
jgi:epoxyqueuosine reductase QueG